FPISKFVTAGKETIQSGQSCAAFVQPNKSHALDIETICLFDDSMNLKLYAYVGPHEIQTDVVSLPGGEIIETAPSLNTFIKAHFHESEDGETLTATFTIDTMGRLLLAPRQTEHVACASGGPVLSAGEISISKTGEVVGVTNQSTGFCPEPESWPAVEAALKRVAEDYPDDFTEQFSFRRCEACGQILIIKDDWCVCDVCDADVPHHWNFED
ncbi:MAG: hypothetical protein AAFX02_03730, partial [Pseudomonadota bacterium]